MMVRRNSGGGTAGSLVDELVEVWHAVSEVESRKKIKRGAAGTDPPRSISKAIQLIVEKGLMFVENPNHLIRFLYLRNF